MIALFSIGGVIPRIKYGASSDLIRNPGRWIITTIPPGFLLKDCTPASGQGRIEISFTPSKERFVHGANRLFQPVFPDDEISRHFGSAG